MQIDRREYKPKNCKNRSKGAWSASRDLFFEFWDPLHISGMGAARDFKFGAPIDGHASKPKNAKVGQKGRGLRHVTYFYDFGTPFISLESTKLEISNLVCGLTSRPTNQKYKTRSKGRGLRHVTYFYNFGTPLYLWNG